MHNYQKIHQDIFYVGVSNRQVRFFENVYPIPEGISYNSYLILDDKNALFDTVDQTVGPVFLENVQSLLQGKQLDYLIITHMEPDHCAFIQEILLRYPSLKIVGNQKTSAMLGQFFDVNLQDRLVIVGEKDQLDLGKHKLQFFMAPMVHWPEVMVVFESTTKTLFSADAFGTFKALNGNIFADEVDFEHEWLSEARRYYANIVGKYGMQVQSLINKIETLGFTTICPLHGPIWRENIKWYCDKYRLWSSYEYEEKGVVIAYGSIYGHTENAANVLANILAQKGVKNIVLFDVSTTHWSYIIAAIFRYSHFVLASSTYNMGIFVNMETLVHNIVHHNVQKKRIGLIENGSWAPAADSLMRSEMLKLKNIVLLPRKITIKSALKNEQIAELEMLANELLDNK